MRSASHVRFAIGLLASTLVLLGNGQSQQRGVIRGVVRDIDRTPIPGARVIAVTAPGEAVRRPQVSVRTGQDGAYELHPRPGKFELRAELPGFCGGGRPLVQVASGEARTVDFTLLLRPIEVVQYVTYPLPETLALADAVVHMRIARSYEPRLMIPDAACGDGNVFIDHELAVITAVKTEHPLWPDAERVLFAQPRAGVYTEGQTTVRGPQPPYEVGQEYVAFLRWWPEQQRFVSSTAPNRMVPVRDGRIVWSGSPEEGVRDGMPLADFLGRLHQLLPPPVASPSFFAVSVDELEAARRWYRVTLGVEPVRQVAAPDGRSRAIVMRRGDLVVELISFTGAPDPEGGTPLPDARRPLRGLMKTGLFVANAEEWHMYLVGRGVETDARVVTDDTLGMRTFVFRDPDGNRIQVFEPCDGACDAPPSPGHAGGS